MGVTIVTRGFIEVWRDGQKISQHSVETKAVESALDHLEANGDGTYELRFPRKDLSRITKTVIPFVWQTQPALSFTQGTPQTVQLRGTYLFDPQSRVRTITVSTGSLPAGCAINGTSIVYDGAGAAASASFTLTASDGTYSQTSASGSATIQASAPANTPPVWTVPENYALPPFTTAGGTLSLSQYAFDAEGDPMVFVRSGGTAPGSVTVSSAGVLTVPAGTAAGNYVVRAGVGTTAEADWQSRITGAVWSHRFAAEDEMRKFRVNGPGTLDYAGSVPGSSDLRWIAGGGPNGDNCIEIYCPPNGHPSAMWWRPFSALPGDAGYTSGDAWNHLSAGQASNWVQGIYAHADYHTSAPTYQGTEFYVQFRAKMSASRFDAASADGKLFYLDTPYGGNHEIVTQAVTSRLYRMYSAFGNINGALWSPQGTSENYSPPVATNARQWQPGGQYATPNGDNGTACTYGNIAGFGAANYCWLWPADEWVTVLVKLKCGHHTANVADMYSGGGSRDNGITVWVARAGETAYTKIWDKQDYVFSMYGVNGSDPIGSVRGWNILKLSGYANGVTSAQSWTHRFAQVIFSRSPIPCPQV